MTSEDIVLKQLSYHNALNVRKQVLGWACVGAIIYGIY